MNEAMKERLKKQSALAKTKHLIHKNRARVTNQRLTQQEYVAKMCKEFDTNNQFTVIELAVTLYHCGFTTEAAIVGITKYLNSLELEGT